MHDVKQATGDKKKKSKVHCKKYKKIACKSINAVWKQDETTTKCMHECTISFLRKKLKKQDLFERNFKTFNQNSVKEFSSTEILHS